MSILPRLLPMTLTLAVLLGSCTMTVASAAPPATSSTTPPPGCTANLASGMNRLLATVNAKQALGLAASSPSTLASQVSTALSARTLNFTGISAMFTFDPQDCSNLSLGQVSVDFDVLDVTIATCAGTRVHPGEQVFENPGLTSVVGVATDNKTGGCSGSGGSVLSSSTADSGPSAVDSSSTSARSFSTNGIWAGYQVNYPVSGTEMKYVTTYFSQPAVSKNSDCRAGAPYQCTLVAWTGLDTGSGFIAQDGTAANIYCSSRSCNAPQYSAWWEFYGYDALQTCSPQGSYPVSPGDSIEAIAENGVNTPGGYDLLVVDTSANPAWVCDSGVHDFSYRPTYAETILERPAVPGGEAHLPTFGSVQLDSNIYCVWGNGGCVNYDYSYTNGAYSAIRMQNCPPGYNIVVSSVDSSGDFTGTWQNSCGT